MNPLEKALNTFEEGFACSQAVLSAYADRFGLDPAMALRLGSPFGGGIARSGELCGAVTGGLMVIGLAYGKPDAEDKPAKELTYEKSQALMRDVQQQFGSVICKQILGEDISTPEGMDQAIQKNLFHTLCCDCIGGVVQSLESHLPTR